ncbi:hypothetical protein [Halospina sp. K52047b]|uniref:hypothetical protein n=1 Tax=Halospina sp. K52047b TaxID=2614160 RepID=UPI00124A1116|nr:hypothetical protein [Halospina sp. K52047b]KAA8983346.1 hypothetical protein F3089_04765 [Halospina sp. K52047b]
MKKYPLPPLVGGFDNGKVTWQSIESVNYDELGYLLSCHLIIEHYLDNFLATYPAAPFGWGAAKLTFSQKVALISELSFPEPYNIPPVIKYLNKLRNRFSHNINKSLTGADLLPISRFVDKCMAEGERNEDPPKEPREVLHFFTLIVCSYFASAISQQAQYGGPQS